MPFWLSGMKEFFQEGPGSSKKDVENIEWQQKHHPVHTRHILDLCPNVIHLHLGIIINGPYRQVVNPIPRDMGGSVPAPTTHMASIFRTG